MQKEPVSRPYLTQTEEEYIEVAVTGASELKTTSIEFIPKILLMEPALLQELRTIDLSGTHITNLEPLAELHITELVMRDCSLQRIEELQFLEMLESMRRLDLSRNSIVCLPRKYCMKLYELNLSENRLWDFGDLEHFSSEIQGQYCVLDLRGNGYFSDIFDELNRQSLLDAIRTENPLINYIFTDSDEKSDIPPQQASGDEEDGQYEQLIEELLDFSVPQQHLGGHLGALLEQINRDDVYPSEVNTQLIRLAAEPMASRMAYNDQFLEFIGRLRYNWELIDLFITYNHQHSVPLNDLIRYSENSCGGFGRVHSTILKQFFMAETSVEHEYRRPVLRLIVSFSALGNAEALDCAKEYLILSETGGNDGSYDIERLVLFIEVFVAPVIKYFEEENAHLNKICETTPTRESLLNILEDTFQVISKTAIVRLLSLYNYLPTTALSISIYFKSLYLLFQQKEYAGVVQRIFEELICCTNTTAVPDYMGIANLQEQLSAFYAKTDNIKSIEADDIIAYSPLVREELKCEILTKEGNTLFLEEYFRNQLQDEASCDPINCLRTCLSDFQLAGEGQSVERAISVLAKVLGERLQKDFKSTLVLIGAILMINTQFGILKTEGKRISNFMTKQDFVEMVTSAPQFNEDHYNRQTLCDVYEQIEKEQLENKAHLCSIFCKQKNVIIDGEHANNTEFFRGLDRIREEQYKEKTNQFAHDYLTMEVYRIGQEITLLQQCGTDIWRLAPQSYIPTLQPFIFSLLLTVLSQNNNKDVIKGAVKLLYLLFDKVLQTLAHNTHLVTGNQLDTAYMVFLNKQNKLFQLLVVTLISFNQLENYLQIEKVVDVLQVQRLLANYRYKTIYKVVYTLLIKVLESEQLLFNEEFLKEVMLYLSYYSSISELIPMDYQTMERLKLRRPSVIGYLSHAGARLVLECSLQLLKELHQSKYSFYDYSQLQNGLFVELSINEAGSYTEREGVEMSKVQIIVQLSSFMTYSIIVGFYMLWQALIEENLSTDSLLIEYLPDIMPLMEASLLEFDQRLQTDIEKTNQELNMLMFQELYPGIKAKENVAPAESIYDMQQAQLDFNITVVLTCYGKIATKEFCILFKKIFADDVAPLVTKNQFTKVQFLESLVSQRHPELYLCDSRSFSLDYVYELDFCFLLKKEESLVELEGIVELLTNVPLSLMSLREENEQLPQLYDYLRNLGPLYEFRTKYVLEHIRPDEDRRAWELREKVNEMIGEGKYAMALGMKIIYELARRRDDMAKGSSLQLARVAEFEQQQIDLNFLCMMTIFMIVCKRHNDFAYYVDYLVRDDLEIRLFIEQFYPYLIRDLKVGPFCEGPVQRMVGVMGKLGEDRETAYREYIEKW